MEVFDVGPTKWNGPGRASGNQKQVQEENDRENESAKVELYLHDDTSNVRREDCRRYKRILSTFGPSERYIDPTRNIASDTA